MFDQQGLMLSNFEALPRVAVRVAKNLGPSEIGSKPVNANIGVP